MEDKISADSCLFVDEMASYEEKKRLCSVHVFLFLVSVCDIFLKETARKLSEKGVFRVLIRLKNSKLPIRLFCKSLRYSG